MALTYQWQRSIGGTSWANITGATSSSYSLTTSSDAARYVYRCVVTSSTNGLSTNSSAASLTMKANSPTVSKHPSNVSVTEGTSINISCAASAPYGSVSYQWEYRTSSSASWQNSGSTSMSFVITTTMATNGRQYRCKITANAGGRVTYTNIATITVKAKAQPPRITYQPRNQTIPIGSTGTIYMSATGDAPLRYKWEYRNKGASSWSTGGATTNSFKITGSPSSDGRQYRCIVSNNAGSVTSNIATISSPS